MSDIRSILSKTFMTQKSDVAVAAGVIIMIMLMILPVPGFLLDFLMILNLLLALLIILIVMFTHHAVEFSIFPSMLLVSTFFGLAVNISSTRLILQKGADFDGAMVKAFGQFVVGSQGMDGLVIGIIIFVILVAVQVVVITKGASRIAEVAARFTLDALPGKQMAIEAEFNSGVITEEEALKKKNLLQKEVDFYGAMDGASKFVSGNVKIGILITLINIVGGIIVGVTIHKEDLALAADNYIRLTIGDGLLSQIPSLLISIASALIVTRAISDGTFGSDITTQFSGNSRVFWIAAVFLVVLGFIPGAGFPTYLLLPMGVGLGVLAYFMSRKKITDDNAVEEETQKEKKQHPAADSATVAPLDPLSLELGYGLIPLVDKEHGAELLERITRIRREAALDLGLMVPRIRIIDNMRLDPNEYSFKIKGVETGKAKIRQGHYLAINPGTVRDEIEGEKTFDPAFGLPARWINETQREKAENSGYTVVDTPSIIATHLTEIIKRHASEILGRQELQSILEATKHDYPAVIEDVKKTLSNGEIQKVLQGLLREQISIRNQVTILETLADYGVVTKDITYLTEKVRQALGRQICNQYSENKKLHVLTVEPSLESQIIESKVETTSGSIAALEPDFYRAWIRAVSNTVKGVQESGHIPIILSSEAARPLIRSSLEREMPDVVVLSVPEIVADVQIEALGEISVKN